MSEAVLFAGDTHMNTKEIARLNAIAKREHVAKIIQVGDFGYTFSDEFLNEIAKASVTWYFIRGNHDSTHWIRKAANVQNMYSGPVCQVAENLHWIPDGTVMQIGGSECAFVGGAASIDKEWREEHVSWWADEEPSMGAFMRLEEEAKGKDIFLLVTHDIPQKLMNDACEAMVFKIAHERSKQARLALDAALEITEPSAIVHGHWHCGYRTYLHDVQVIGLDCDTREENHVVLEL